MAALLLAILIHTPLDTVWLSRSHASHAPCEAKDIIGRPSSAPTQIRLARCSRRACRVVAARRHRYRSPVRVATWNVNSVKQRLARLLPWLDQREPDVVCLQETKLADEAFDRLLSDELAGRGYAIARHGEAQWNGVAILSRTGLDAAVVGVAGAPGFPHPEARAVSATCG